MKLTVQQLRKIVKEEVARAGGNKVVNAWYVRPLSKGDMGVYVWKYADGSGNAAFDKAGKLGKILFVDGVPFEEEAASYLHPIPIPGAGKSVQVEPAPVPVAEMEALIAAAPKR